MAVSKKSYNYEIRGGRGHSYSIIQIVNAFNIINMFVLLFLCCAYSLINVIEALYRGLVAKRMTNISLLDLDPAH